MIEIAADPSPAASQPRKGRRWQLSLGGQFVLLGSIVLILGAVCIGLWISARLRDDVTRHTAAATALYMHSVVAPLAQELKDADRITPENQAKLDNILKNTELGKRIVSFKIWKKGGLIAYSSRPSLIGRTFETTANLRDAWKGHITAEFDTLEDEEDAEERAEGIPLLEMYAPIRDHFTGEVIAVAEFYEVATTLKENMYAAQRESWFVIAGVMSAMMLALSSVVMRGGRTIERQRAQLEARVDELSRLLAQNKQLHRQVLMSSSRTAEINERYLRRLGADLHDGPAQLVSFALLRIDALRRKVSRNGSNDGSARTDDFDSIHNALHEAMSEIREFSAGLTLSRLEDLSPKLLFTQILATHEKRTNTKVVADVRSLPETMPLPIKIAIYRFVQEALNNAFRHAGGVGVKVAYRSLGRSFEVEVSDEGPGFPVDHVPLETGGLGLNGLHERIRSLGGTLTIDTTPGRGTRLVMQCRMNYEDPAADVA